MEICGFLNDSLERLDYIEKERNQSVQVKDQFRILKVELKFLRTFLLCAEMKVFSGTCKLARLLRRTEAVVQDAGEIILSLYVETTDGSLPMDLNRWLSYMLAKIELIKPEVSEGFFSVSMRPQSDFVDIEYPELNSVILESLLENLMDLLQCEDVVVAQVKKLVEAYRKRLTRLRNSFQSALKLGIANNKLVDPLSKVVDLAVKGASHSYHCWINKMDEDKAFSLEDSFSRLINHSIYGLDNRNFYICILNALMPLPSDTLMADGLIMTYTDFLLECLSEVQSLNERTMVSTNDHLESLHEELTRLRTLLMTTPLQYAEHEKLIRMDIEEEVKTTEHIIRSFYVGNMDEEMSRKMNARLFLLLERCKLIKSELCLMRLLNCEATLVVPMKNQLETLREDIQVLRTSLINPQEEYFADEKCIDLPRLDAVASEAGTTIYSFYFNGTKEDLEKEMNSLLPDLVEKIKLVRNRCCFLDDSLVRLDYLQKHWNWSVLVKAQIQTIKMELKFLRTFLKCAVRNTIKDSSLNDLLLRTKAVVQDVGEAILSIYVETTRGKIPTYVKYQLSYVLEKIELIKPAVDRDYYSIAQKGSASDAACNGKLTWRCRMLLINRIFEFVDSLLENLKDLLQFESSMAMQLKDQVDIVGKKLRFLRNSLKFSVEQDTTFRELRDLMVETEFVAEYAASSAYNCWIHRMDENEASKKKPAFSYLSNREPLRHKVTESCITILKASKSLPSETPMTDELLVKFIGFLQENLWELLNHNGDIVVSANGHLESIHKELTNLRTLCMQHAKHEKTILLQIEAEVKVVAHIIYSFYIGNMNKELARNMKLQLFCLLERFKLIKSELCLLELLDHEASLILSVKDQMETFCEYIQLLRSFLMDPPKDDANEKFHDLLKCIEVVASEAGSAIYSVYAHDRKDDVSTEMNYILPDLVNKIKLIKADIRLIYLYGTSSNIGKESALSFMNTVLRKLDMLLVGKADSISIFLKPQIEQVKKELELLRCFLKNSAEQCIEHEELIALESRIIHAANEVKHAIDPFLLRDYSVWYCLLQLSDAIDEIKLIKKEIKRINEKTSSWILSSQANTFSKGEVFVGFKDEVEKVIDWLIRGPAKLKVISIIGMPGLGKTSLAKKLYDDPSVAEHFYVQAWCCVSQVYEQRQLLLEILRHFVELNDKINEKSVEDLSDMLRKRLKGQRYLIVMDDIWDMEAWSALSRCFPDDSKGSRIMFTTRYQKVAWDLKDQCIPHHLRFFSDEESRELLFKKLLQKERSPSKLLEIVKPIAKKCHGLPLAIVLIAGVLARIVEEEWPDVAESLNSCISGIPESLSMEVVELSYKHLPNHLRPCFLYLGAFPEDKDIMVQRLIRLWAAEGFILSTKENSLEDIAKDYLVDLMARSLVIDVKKGSNGEVKSFRIHDFLRSFCLGKAREENFLLLLDDHNEPFAHANQYVQRYEHVAPSPHSIDYIESHGSTSLNSNPITYDEQHRLCIYSTLNGLAEWRSSSLHVCSLLNFAPVIHLDTTSFSDTAFIFSSFTLLRVLDLGCLILEDLNCGIELLINLRFLAVWIQSKSIPSSISNLKNLETFLVKGIKGEVELPNTIWSMVRLRHLHIDYRASIIWDENKLKDTLLDNLETLSTPVLSCGVNLKGMIHSLPNLRKLKCIYTECWNNFDHCNYFPVLDSLSQLESLKVLYHGRKLNSCKFSFPPNLRKLTLSKMRLPWSDIARIARLPNLEVLKLLFRAFEGKQWETNDGEFLKLKYLKLESLDIAEWMTYRDHFPRLERLILHRCKQLEEIPSDLGDIDTLQIIEVLWCSPSAATSARQIYEEQQDMGNELFKVVIQDLAASF